jgi:iron complex transport system substrate-binding protein
LLGLLNSVFFGFSDSFVTVIAVCCGLNRGHSGVLKPECCVVLIFSLYSLEVCMKKMLLLSSVLLTGLVLAAPVQVRDGLGRSVTVNAPAKRIVALSLTATEILIDIGANPIGRPSSATHPDAALRIPEVGSAYRPDLEKILGLRPDLLIGSVGTTAAARQLGALPMPLIVTPDSSLKDVYDTYTLFGKLTNREAYAAARLDFLKSRVKRSIAKVPSNVVKPKVLALLAAGGQVFSTTDETYIGDLLEKAGANNVAKGTPSADPRQPGFVVLSLEQIVAANPDVIVAFRAVTATGAVAPSPTERLEQSAAWKNLNAVKNNRVHILSSDPFVTAPGPRAVETLDTLIPLLYPKK